MSQLLTSQLPMTRHPDWANLLSTIEINEHGGLATGGRWDHSGPFTSCAVQARILALSRWKQGPGLGNGMGDDADRD